MKRYLAGRIIQAIGVVAFVTTLAFVLIHLAPGDPIGATLSGPNVTPVIRQQWRENFGLDRPIGEQYVLWISNVFHGRLGYSFSQRSDVSTVFAQALPLTLMLGGLGLIASFALGITVALAQVRRAGGATDRWLGRALLFVYSLPDFWLALVILLLFSYRLGLFPPGGVTDAVSYEYMSASERVLDRLRHLVLPVGTLALLSTASIARYQRAALLDVLPDDFIRTALAKGNTYAAVVRDHAFRNALLPAITLVGLALPAFATGTIFIERVFSWRGLGYVIVSAVAARDYALVTAGVMVASVIVVVGGLIADVAVAVADPRIRLS